MQILKVFDEELYDMNIYLDIDFSFSYIDERVVYILIFFQLLIFIGISKNLGYNVKKN